MFLQLFLSFWSDAPIWWIVGVIFVIVFDIVYLVVKFSKKYSKRNRIQTKAINRSYSLKKGMTKQEVLSLLGTPYYNSYDCWIYRQYVYNNNLLTNYTKEGTNEVRIRFDENGLVSEVTNAHDITTTTYYQR